MKFWKLKTHLVAKEFFQYSLITFFILQLTETIKPGLVSFFFNFNILLLIILFSGAVMVLTYSQKIDKKLNNMKKPNGITRKGIAYIILLTASGAILVYFNTADLGITSIAISILTAIIISLLAVVVLTDKE